MKTSKQTLRTIILSLLIATNIFAFSACNSQSTEPINTVSVHDSKCPENEYKNHDWLSPTCIEPAKCFWCGVYKDEKLSEHHNWYTYDNGLTKCQDCNILREDWLTQQGQNSSSNGCINGHTQGNWTITKYPTLVSAGVEELLCNVCDKLLDSRTVQKKLPQVESDHFNFTDKEFIEWFNNKDGSYIISNTELGEYGNDSPFTSYKITFSDGETGTIMLSHGDVGDNIIDKNGFITGIYVDGKTSYAAATVVWIGKEINSKFDIDDAINNLLSDKSYISAQMYCNYIDFSDGTAIAYLEPYQ